MVELGGVKRPRREFAASNKIKIRDSLARDPEAQDRLAFAQQLRDQLSHRRSSLLAQSLARS